MAVHRQPPSNLMMFKKNGGNLKRKFAKGFASYSKRLVVVIAAALSKGCEY